MDDLTKQSDKKEHLIRGRIIQISATIESLIARLIILVNINNPDKEVNVPFKNMMYTAKLKKLVELFQIYYPDVYTANISVFDSLDNIKEFRNKIAHCMFKWADPTLKSFDIIDAEKHTDGTHHFVAARYTIEDCLNKIEEFKKTTLSLLRLVIQIEEDLGKKIPGFLELIRSAQNDFSK